MNANAVDTSQIPLMESHGLDKQFPGVRALNGVSFRVMPGEVHALVGENGAGKSTLMRMFSGLDTPDAGTMLRDAQPYAPTCRREAEARGVRMVLQELNILDTLTVAENLFFDRLPKHMGGIIHRAALRTMAREALDRVGLTGFDPDTPAANLGIGQKQMVEIAAGLARQCRVLILDEPTASLTQPEITALFDQIRKLRQRGMGIVYISHRMEEILQIADRVSIMRDGCMVDSYPAQGLTVNEIIRLMVGRSMSEESLFAPPDAVPGPPALRVRGLRRAPSVHDVSFDLHRGEILGISGLVGAGRTEAVRCIFGADIPDGGEIFVGDATTPAKIRSPREAVRLGIALLPEDRKQQGLLLNLPIRVNTTLARMQAVCGKLPGWIVPKRETDIARKYTEQLSVKCAGVEQPVGTLSGGNQQKVVIARWMLRDCDVLIFDEPTRGIDMGARMEIYRLLRRLASEEHKAVLIVSSDLMELTAVCDRIAVMSAGFLVADFPRGQWTSEKIMAAALSKHLEHRGETQTAAEGA